MDVHVTKEMMLDAIDHLDVNDAGKRADEAIVRIFGQEKFDKEIGALRDGPGGYKAMFENKPTPERLMWIVLVVGFVNGWDKDVKTAGLREAMDPAAILAALAGRATLHQRPSRYDIN